MRKTKVDAGAIPDGKATPDFQMLFEHMPLMAVALLPDEPVFTIISVNDVFIRTSGVSRERLVGRSVFEVFPDNPDNPAADGVRNLRASLRRVIVTGEPDRMPRPQRYDVERPEDGSFEERYWSVLNAPVFAPDGRMEYLLQTVEEITAKVHAEEREQDAIIRLETSENRFRQLAEMSTFGILIGNLDGGISYLNPALSALLGYSAEDVAAGLVNRASLTPSEFSILDERAVQTIAETGKCMPYEKAYVAKDGRRIPVLIAASALESASGRKEVAALVVDLTERRQSERDAFLVELDDAMRPLVDPEAIIDVAVHLLGGQLSFDGCAYCTFDADEETFYVARDYTRAGAPSLVGTHTLTEFGTDVGTLLRAGLPFLLEDVETDPRMDAARENYRVAGICATVTVPLHKAGHLVGAMGVNQSTPRRWLPEEVAFVRVVANRCWESIERARVTREFQTSERRLRLAQQAGRIGSFDWLIKEQKIIWTPELEMLYGLPEGTFEGAFSDWTKRLEPADAGRVEKDMADCLARKQTQHTYEFRAVLPDGTPRWLRGQAQFFYDEAGAPERMVGVNIDIDAHKQGEAHLRQQWHIFDLALSNTPDFIYTFDLQGRFTYANRALLSLWQKSFDEMLGKSFFELDYTRELATRLHRQIQEVIESKQPVRDQTSYKGANGQTRDYEYILVPVLDAEGRAEAVAGSTRDITEHRRAEVRERQRQEQIRESARLESLGVMAGGIAHDFNNLLTAILGNASMLAEGEGDRSAAEQIVLAAERAADLTKQMLAFSGRGGFVTEAVDVNLLVRENLMLLRASLSRNISVELDLAPDACIVMADRAQVQQVVMNLLINASEAIGDSPGEVKICTTIKDRQTTATSEFLHVEVSPGSYVLLEVRDTGSGMSPETLKRIFDPFFTTKFTGRGLGLAATLGIVRGHKGEIEVESQLGVGTKFTVWLPLTDVDAIREKKPGAASRAHANGKTVLVVDDEEIVQRMARAALESRGFSVAVAGNGSEALEILRTRPGISLVILDLTMPVMTGQQTLPLIQAMAPGVPIILSSGFDEVELARRFGASGVTGFLGKPYTVAAMMAKVTSALETHSKKTKHVK